MRILHLLTFLFSSLSLTAAAELALPAFWVVKSERDKTLKTSEAVFQLEFLNEEFSTLMGGQMILQYACNNIPGEIHLSGKQSCELKMAPGTYRFVLFAGPQYLEIYSDSVKIQPGFRSVVNVHFTQTDYPVISDKPVICLYPEKDTEVTVNVAPQGDFTFTYPLYENGWKGTAHPDGSITVADKTYPYLFWEARQNSSNPFTGSKGFVVSRGATVAFLEEKLTAIGLNEKEQTDFITYWGPRLTSNERCFVQFVFNDSCDQFAGLDISPAPDHLNRVYIVWAAIDQQLTISPEAQELVKLDRSGFDVLEWGGSEIPAAALFNLQSSIH